MMILLSLNTQGSRLTRVNWPNLSKDMIQRSNCKSRSSKSSSSWTREECCKFLTIKPLTLTSEDSTPVTTTFKVQRKVETPIKELLSLKSLRILLKHWSRRLLKPADTTQEFQTKFGWLIKSSQNSKKQPTWRKKKKMKLTRKMKSFNILFITFKSKQLT